CNIVPPAVEAVDEGLEHGFQDAFLAAKALVGKAAAVACPDADVRHGDGERTLFGDEVTCGLDDLRFGLLASFRMGSSGFLCFGHDVRDVVLLQEGAILWFRRS